MTRAEWRARLRARMRPIHKHYTARAVEQMLATIDSTAKTLRARSRKAGVACTVGLEDLREMVVDAYGRPCPYCDRVLTRHTLVVDHRVPIAAGGPSSRENLQIICRTCNGTKGSLAEADFVVLSRFLATAPKPLADDLRRRLCRVR